MMDEHKDHDHPHHHGLLKSRLVMKLFAALLVVTTVFVGAKAVNALINFDTLAQPPSNVITVNGEGKASATPDIATVSFTISEDADTSAHAQDAAAKKINVAVALLKSLKVADKDVKTSAYNISPRYSQPTPCYSAPCVYNYDQKIIGFTASETVDVKIRTIDDTGKILAALGEAGVNNLYGPNFSVENPDAVKAEARKEAIAKARAQAKTLAGDLGVRLVRVVSYSENGGYPVPYMKADMAMSAGSAPARPEVTVPTGENEVTVDVSVTYEIR